MLGPSVTAPSRSAERAIYDWRLGTSQVDDFLRVFCIGLSLPPSRVGAALGSYDLDAARADGLVEADGDLVRSTLLIKSYGGRLIAADRSDYGADRDHVIGVNPTAMTLAGLTVRGSMGSVLDVGTGGGVQALLASVDATHVTGIDINRHAVDIARFNGRMNGVDNVTWLEGDRFAPIAGQRFDRVVSNPPYVISPDNVFVYRDGGMTGDGMSESVVRDAAGHLAEGGFATVLCNWMQQPDEPWYAQVHRWVAESGCDALVIRFSSTVPLAYAMRWNGHLANFDEPVERWVRYYEEAGVEALGDGGVILRRRTGGNWFRTIDVEDSRVGRCSEQLVALFNGVDTAERADDELLKLKFAVPPGVQLVETTEPASQERSARLVQAGGFGLDAELDAPSLHLIRACRGDTPLAAVLDDVATEFGIERADAVGIGLSVVRRMLGIGFLTA